MPPDEHLEETELQAMSRGDEADRSDPNAPLLASDRAISPDNGDRDARASRSQIDIDYSGGWFIWALTFSAGISGLLFGYEYVHTMWSLYFSPTKLTFQL